MTTNKKFRKKLYLILLIGIVIASILHFLSSKYTLSFGRQHCLEGTLWLVLKNTTPQKGDYIAFRGTNIPHGEKIRFLKIITGIEGDSVHVTPTGEKDYMEVIVNNMPRTLKVRAYIKLMDNKNKITEYPVFEKGLNGKELPFVWKYGTTKIKNGFYVAGTHPASYDSRYWGILNEKDVIGKAILLF